MSREIRVFRYDPSSGESRFDRFRLDIPDETATTILDVLLRLQREQDPTLAFRFACRVAMCGSCGMVINGTEAMACKTNVAHIAPGAEITIRPLNHFPVIKDLVVDMGPFFQRFEEILPFFEPKIQSAGEIARIRPDSPERIDIGDATECIACGCCVSSCTMVHHHAGYAGPAALNRAFTLLTDSRDGLFEERLTRALGSCYQCRTEFNCTEVCPKGISPSRAIKHIQRLALQHPASVPASAASPAPEPAQLGDRRGFPWRLALKVTGAVAAALVIAEGTRAVFGPAAQALFYGRGEWVLPAVVLALIVALPLLGRAALRRAAHRPLAVSASVTCAVGLVYLSCLAVAATRPHGRTFLVPDRQLTASETRGLYLYVSSECAFCHQIRGTGGHRTGPDLGNMVVKGRTRDYLAGYIRDPQKVAAMSTMPKYNLPEQDLLALADFLLALDFGGYRSKTLKREEVLHE